MTNESLEPVYVGIAVSKDSLAVAWADKAASKAASARCATNATTLAL